MQQFFEIKSLACLSFAAAIGLAGCSSKENVGPESSCATTATVYVCQGPSVKCAYPATLELANGLILRPSGKVWEAYQPRQLNGEVLKISYEILPRLSNDAPGYENALLTCLETAQGWCGTR